MDVIVERRTSLIGCHWTKWTEILQCAQWPRVLNFSCWMRMLTYSNDCDWASGFSWNQLIVDKLCAMTMTWILRELVIRTFSNGVGHSKIMLWGQKIMLLARISQNNKIINIPTKFAGNLFWPQPNVTAIFFDPSKFDGNLFWPPSKFDGNLFDPQQI